MFRAPLYRVCGGECCQVLDSGDAVQLIVREDGRMIRRMLEKKAGKQYGVREVSYADAYFEFPSATVEMVGEELLFTRRENA